MRVDEHAACKAVFGENMSDRSGESERKALARQKRREAYQAAKERRKNDPRYLAMKEAARQQRREAYREAKLRQQAAAKEEKLRARREKDEERAEHRAELDAELMLLLRMATKGSNAQN